MTSCWLVTGQPPATITIEPIQTFVLRDAIILRTPAVSCLYSAPVEETQQCSNQLAESLRRCSRSTSASLTHAISKSSISNTTAQSTSELHICIHGRTQRHGGLRIISSTACAVHKQTSYHCMLVLVDQTGTASTSGGATLCRPRKGTTNVWLAAEAWHRKRRGRTTVVARPGAAGCNELRRL
ncbi:hypothetical protein CONLIGDRAFT_143147 [Coniochaeta ligniaria NRRL 30616]|uniref:Uncharacterized protein n=1 Tax=Coniochaeta ligniaria NRRL 30616 TaxID=1408157 RepID=A0A1J7I6Z7_9PEZI|nr:hypothetical protein CONLIGDRAFT_143147 [Coniochaeta ligniaria NRRL 30616]